MFKLISPGRAVCEVLGLPSITVYFLGLQGLRFDFGRDWRSPLFFGAILPKVYFFKKTKNDLSLSVYLCNDTIQSCLTILKLIRNCNIKISWSLFRVGFSKYMSTQKYPYNIYLYNSCLYTYDIYYKHS